MRLDMRRAIVENCIANVDFVFVEGGNCLSGIERWRDGGVGSTGLIAV
jgi:hypothetical protein